MSHLIFTVKVPGGGVGQRSLRNKLIRIWKTFLDKGHERCIWVTNKLLTVNSINKNKGKGESYRTGSDAQGNCVLAGRGGGGRNVISPC